MFHEKLCIIPIYYNYVIVNKNMYIISIFTPLKFNVTTPIHFVKILLFYYSSSNQSNVARNETRENNKKILLIKTYLVFSYIRSSLEMIKRR